MSNVRDCVDGRSDERLIWGSIAKLWLGIYAPGGTGNFVWWRSKRGIGQMVKCPRLNFPRLLGEPARSFDLCPMLESHDLDNLSLLLDPVID